MKPLRFLILTLLFAVFPLLVNAQQPVIAADGIHNAASYALAGMPNAGIAQGSLFVVFGSNLGPTSLQLISGLPVPASFAGTSVRVTSGGTSVDALMIYTSAGQLAAVLPSNTPLGNATVTVTYNGQTSAPAPITVVRSTFGIFGLNQAGSGPGVLQNVISQTDQPLNSITAAAHPGQLMILWGTGLGPITVGGSEANGAGLGVDMPNLNLHVWVGGRDATVQYRGRGCCVGLDQIAFTVPPGVEGCYVSVAVQIDNIVSNFVTMSIASSGSTCTDPTGYTNAELTQAQTRGSISVGSVNLTRLGFQISEPGLGTFNFNTDNGSAAFNRYTYDQLKVSQGICVPPAIGTCLVRTFRAGDVAADPVSGIGLNAGPVINISGPKGAKQLPQTTPGYYSATLSGSFNPFGPSTDYLDAGSYSINNAGGSSGPNTVGAFQLNHVIPPNLVWTNQDSITAVNRAQGVTVNWTGGSANGYVGIYGSSTNLANTAGASFVCFASAAAGSFTIPTSILLALPPSSPSALDSSSFLAVGSISPPTRFTATGIDLGFVNSSVQTAKTVPYQ
jgi:uncharacterized protein (TIGR03437 family)